MLHYIYKILYYMYLKSDDILHFEGSLKVHWPRHAVSDDGRLECNHRLTISESLADFIRDVNRPTISNVMMTDATTLHHEDDDVIIFQVAAEPLTYSSSELKEPFYSHASFHCVIHRQQKMFCLSKQKR